MTSPKARIAIFCGDPAGIGPELVQRLLDDPKRYEHAHIHLIGQQVALKGPASVTVHTWDGLLAPPFDPGEAGASNGCYMLEGLRQGLALAQEGAV
ncbi:MAG: 4-hydroxythreonine-4-phosphate dehydrogenase PdxA, partial [Burkholderiales bacterium]